MRVLHTSMHVCAYKRVLVVAGGSGGVRVWVHTLCMRGGPRVRVLYGLIDHHAQNHIIPGAPRGLVLMPP